MGQHMQQTTGTLAHDDLSNIMKSLLNLCQLIGVYGAGQVADEEIFGL